MRFFTLLLTLFVVTPLVYAQSFVKKDGSTKLLICSDTPCVDVQVGDQKLRFGIDTSQPRSIVDVDLPKYEGLDVYPYVGRDGKPNPAYQKTVLPSVKFGTVELKELPVVVSQLKHLRAGNVIPEVDGILGYDAFQGKDLTLDLKKLVLTVKGGGSCSGGALKVTSFGPAGPQVLTTTGFSVEGKPVVAQVDMLFLGSMLVYPDAVNKLGLTGLTNSKLREHFAYTDGGVDMIMAPAKEDFNGKSVGADVYFATPQVHVPISSIDAKIGMKLLTGHVVTFDFASNCFGLN